MRDRLEILRERLLREGVSPGLVRRYIGELTDHLDDLTDELVAAGLSGARARSAAWRRLGSYEGLALPLLVDRRNRSWASRLPWLVYLVAPLLTCIVASILLAVALHGAARMPQVLPLLPDLGAAAAIILLAVTLATAWIVQLAGLLQRSAAVWPIAGALAVALLGSLVELGVTMPAPSAPGHIALAMTQPTPVSALMLGLALLPLAVARLTRLVP